MINPYMIFPLYIGVRNPEPGDGFHNMGCVGGREGIQIHFSETLDVIGEIILTYKMTNIIYRHQTFSQAY